MSDSPQAVGEVIAVSTVEFDAQSYRLNESPAFGSLVLTRSPEGLGHFGLCFATETGSIEPGRSAIAWGGPDEAEGDIYDRQPQLLHVLRTTFSCLLVGYAGPHGRPVQRVPARPPRVHERVWHACDEEVCAFFSDLSYLRFVLRADVENVEDLIAASVGQAYRARGGDRAFLVEAGRSIARILAADHARLTAVLELLTGMEDSI